MSKYVYYNKLLSSSDELHINNEIKLILKTIWYYPIIIIGFTLMYIIWRIFDLSAEHPPTIIIIFAIGIGNLFGLANFIVFVSNKTISKKLKSQCCCFHSYQKISENVPLM